nr:hypothetical protein [Tanacetum cinerariifolium]
ADIQGEQYYKEYLEKVAKHQRYLTGEERGYPDSPAPKLAKATKKSKPSAPKVDLRPPVTKTASSQQPKPKPAPAKSQEKKRKLVTETSDNPSLAKRSKSGLVTKRRKPTSSLRSIDESVDEGIPEKEPRFDDEEANIQRKMEESLKSVHDAPRGSLPPVVIKEPDSGKFQPLLEVQGKDKEKRRTPASTKPSGHAESLSIYAELGLTDSASEFNEEVPPVAGSDPDDDAEPQPQSSPIVHAGPNLEHIDLEAMNVSTQIHPEQMDENLKLTVKEQVILEEPASFTGTLSSLQHLAKDFSFGNLFFNDKPTEAGNKNTTVETEAESMVSVTIQQDTSAIPPMTTPTIDLTSRPDSPNAHRPLQATATETTMTTTTTTTTHPPPPQPQQSTTDSIDLPEANMKVILYQQMWETNSYKAHEDHMMLYEALEKSMNHNHTDELLKDLTEERRKKKKRRDSPKMPPGSLPHQPPPPPPPAAPSSSKTVALAEYTAWTTTDTRLRAYVSSIPEDLDIDDDMASDAQECPYSQDLDIDDDMASDAQVHSSDDEDIRNAHIPKVNLQQDWWKPLKEDRPATPEPAWFIPSSDLPVPTNNWASALASTYTPPQENSLLAQTGDMAMFMDWFCKRQGIIKLKPQDLEGTAFELVKVFHPNVIHLQYQMEECHKLLTDSVDESIVRHNVSKPLPLGGPPSQVTI